MQPLCICYVFIKTLFVMKFSLWRLLQSRGANNINTNRIDASSHKQVSSIFKPEHIHTKVHTAWQNEKLYLQDILINDPTVSVLSESTLWVTYQHHKWTSELQECIKQTLKNVSVDCLDWAWEMFRFMRSYPVIHS